MFYVRYYRGKIILETIIITTVQPSDLSDPTLFSVFDLVACLIVIIDMRCHHSPSFLVFLHI